MMRSMHAKTWLVGGAVIGALLLAAGFRFYDIQNYPPGLFPDEAANGEDALLILNGDLRPFYPRGNGREALFFYLEALSVRLAGIGVWQLHAVSAAVGVTTVVAMYFATRVWFGRLAGLLAALFLATNHWQVTLSRTGFRAILVPLFVALFTAWVGYTVAEVRRGKTGRSYLYAALAGAALAGGFYSYIAYRVMIGVVVGVVGLLLLAALHPKIGYPHGRRYRAQLAIAALAALLVIAPLAVHFAQHPADFFGRAGQVSVFNPDLQREHGGLAATVLYSLRTTLFSFFAGAGDLNWRHSVAGFPLLNPLVGMLFLLGLAWTIRGTSWVAVKIIRGEEIHLGMIYPYLLLLLAGMLLPVVTTAEALPHGLRSIGLVFPVFLLAGTAGAVALRWLMARLRGQEAAWGLVVGVAAGLVLVMCFYDGALYFGVSRNDAEAHYAYRGDLTVVAQWLNDYLARQDLFDRQAGGGHDPARPYLVLDDFSLQTPHFLLSVTAHDFQEHPDAAQHRYRAVRPEMAHLVQLEPGEVIVFTQSTLPDADRFAEFNPGATLVTSQRNRFGQEIMRVYQLAAEPEVEGIQDPGGTVRYDLDA
jgi:hypothetical protein